MKQDSDFSGHIESQVKIGYLAIDGGMDQRTIKANIAHYLTEQIAGRLPRKGMKREGREIQGRPFVMAEIESAL